MEVEYGFFKRRASNNSYVRNERRERGGSREREKERNDYREQSDYRERSAYRERNTQDAQRAAEGEESVFSKRVRAGKRRTYFFDVRKTRGNDYFITITESTRRDDGYGGYRRHKIFLYKEDFNRFVASLNEVVNHVKTDLLPDFDYEEFDRRQAEWEAQHQNQPFNEGPDDEIDDFNEDFEEDFDEQEATNDDEGQLSSRRPSEHKTPPEEDLSW
ncbi:MAG: PUR family DNA/RNA-binding protein [Saprospiraceae bacterium]|nr:PUR family DNA/RNA-binding protein [Saprospiraceae bacterium]MDW8483563.1 DUF3276 family protein [Saprospiraceae bacterium]